MLELIRIEAKKMKHSFSMGMLLIGEVVGLLFGTILYVMNAGVFKAEHSQWLALWSEGTVFSSQIFIPLFTAIVVALICKVDIDNKNFERMAQLPLKPLKIIIAKFCYLSLITLVAQIIFLVLFVVIGAVLRFPWMHNVSQFIRWTFMGWIGLLAIIAIQFLISLLMNSLAISVLVSFAASIGGFVVALLSKNVVTYYPFSQMMIGIHSKELFGMSATQVITFLITVFTCIVFGLILTNVVLTKRLRR
ncbi:transporter [Periweissella cryptocerci]|uniref:Transporter n=1 Tax=Periweissella cryptocerci TaxID=2506420 RepID=A0A4P6YUA1_9LACO|nr:ABC transporter permease [Periweissella cryptocerci]QBO36291.1 transporter [Periweissella cryptocerci]